MLSFGDPPGAELVGLSAVGAGFRAFPQEFAAVVRLLSYIGLAQDATHHQTSKKTSSDVFFCACAPARALRRLPSDRRHGPVYQQIHRNSGLQTAQRKAALGAQSGAAE